MMPHSRASSFLAKPALSGKHPSQHSRRDVYTRKSPVVPNKGTRAGGSSPGGRLRAFWATPRGSGRGRAGRRMNAMPRRRFAREGPCGHPGGSRNIDEIPG